MTYGFWKVLEWSSSQPDLVVAFLDIEDPRSSVLVTNLCVTTVPPIQRQFLNFSATRLADTERRLSCKSATLEGMTCANNQPHSACH